MNILLAIDSSLPSEAAVREVIARPWPEGTNICVLSVVETPFLVVTPDIIQTATEAARASAKSAAERIETTGIRASAAVIYGHPRTDIAKYAKGWGADFVIVGSHGRGGLARFLLGSVAQGVLRGAHCSVEVVREGELATGGMKILLAVDGSEFSVEAARSVTARPWPEGSEVKVLSVVNPVIPVEALDMEPEVIEQLRNEATHLAQEAVEQAEEVVEKSGMKVSTSVLLGNPRAAIVDEAKEWGANLIVLGSHGRTGFNRLLLGSVSEAVALHAHCSVEVIRANFSKGSE
jgi:nucleotide-binding universal stress UspA family protein